MDPTIQLIQLTLRIEREAKIQRHSSMAYRDDLADERTVHPLRQDYRICSGTLFRAISEWLLAVL